MGNKLIGVVCLLLLMVPAMMFATGGSEGSTDQEIELTIFRWDTGAGRPAYENAIARFEAAHPGVTVELSDVPWGEFIDSMVKFQMAEELPDVFVQYDASIGSFYSMGSLLPLDDLLPAELKDEIYPGQWNLGVVNGETVGVTFRNGAHVLFYNKDMFREAGVPQHIIDNGPGTYSEVLLAAELCTIDRDGDGVIDQYGYSDNYGDEEGYHQLRSLMMAAGSGPVDTSTFVATMNDQKGVDALQFLVDLNTKGYVPAGSLAKSNNLKKEEFANGLTAMIEGGNWIEATVVEAGLGFDLGVTFVPYPDDVNSSQGASAAFVAHSVASNTEYPQLAADLDDPATRAAVTAERAALARLEAGCAAPMGAAAVVKAGQLRLQLGVFSSDGVRTVRTEVSGPPESAVDLGRRAAEEALNLGASVLLGESVP